MWKFRWAHYVMTGHFVADTDKSQHEIKEFNHGQVGCQVCR